MLILHSPCKPASSESHMALKTKACLRMDDLLPETSCENKSVLLIGASSVSGFSIVRKFPHRVIPLCNPFNRSSPARSWLRISLESRGVLKNLFARTRPDIVIFAHAVCDVPKCEANPDWAWRINVGNLENILAELSDETRFVYLSSDHVFGEDGIYTEISVPQPISCYGETRVSAEQRVLDRPGSLIIRAGLPIGPSIDGKTGHMDWLAHRLKRGLPITIIGDESRCVYRADDLAGRLMKLSESTVTGIRHVPAGQFISRPYLAEQIALSLGLKPRFSLQSRCRQPWPHMGRVELRTIYSDEFSAPLPALTNLSISWKSPFAGT